MELEVLRLMGERVDMRARVLRGDDDP